MASKNFTIEFVNTGDSAKVSDYSKGILKDLMKNTGIAKFIITSTARSSYDQARIMFDNIEKHSVEHQKKLYGSSGDKVIDVYVEAKKQNKNRTETIVLMKAKIDAIGPGKVSRHAADINVLNVVDIAPSSITTDKRLKFEKAVKAENRISRYFTPPKDPAYHLEIPQPEK